jgi:hypothetical protein
MHALWPESLGAERGGDGRVDASRDADDHVSEAVLLDVILQAESQRAAHLLELRLERHGLGGPFGTGHRQLAEVDDGDGWNRVPRSLELPPADVAQASAHCERWFEVDEEEMLLEARCPRHDLARVVEHQRVPVEHELVLAADEIAEGEEGARVPGSRDEHLLALLGLADVER